MTKTHSIFPRTVCSFCLLTLLLHASPLSAQESPAAAKESTSTPRVSVNADYFMDSRDFNNLTIYASSKNLPFGFSAWGFTDFFSPQRDNRQRFDFTRSFSEYRLSHGILGEELGIKGLGFQAEYNGFTSAGRDLVRLGVTYKHALPIPALGPIGGSDGWLQWRVFPYETDDDGGQLSLIFSMPLHERAKITGFADLNIDDHGTTRWVIEPALALKVYDQIWGLIEYRYNEYERKNPNLRGAGVAVGLRVEF